MKKIILTTSIGLTTLCMINPAYAIDAKYRAKLERSGCTQVSETQGCDINKSKAENAKAGFLNNTVINRRYYYKEISIEMATFLPYFCCRIIIGL